MILAIRSQRSKVKSQRLSQRYEVLGGGTRCQGLGLRDQVGAKFKGTGRFLRTSWLGGVDIFATPSCAPRRNPSVSGDLQRDFTTASTVH